MTTQHLIFILTPDLMAKEIHQVMYLQDNVQSSYKSLKKLDFVIFFSHYQCIA